MFKHIKNSLLFCICISSVIFVFLVGYPVKTHEEVRQGNVIRTKRCFKVGELNQYLNCLISHESIKGVPLVKELTRKLDAFFPYFYLLFWGFGAAALVLLYREISSIEDKT